MDRVVCVHVASPAGEAEFRFADATYRVQDGALIVVDGQGSDLMALSAGLWRAAWIADGQGRPIGLSGPLPASSPTGPAPAAQPSSPSPAPAERAEPKPSATPASTERAEPKVSAAPAPAKIDHAPAIFAALSQAPYAGLADLAFRIGLPAEEIERSLSSALGRSIEPGLVALAPIQARLEGLMPDILASAPQNLVQILTQLREKDPEAGFDLIQLRVWIKRNPSKRQS